MAGILHLAVSYGCHAMIAHTFTPDYGLLLEEGGSSEYGENRVAVKHSLRAGHTVLPYQ